MAGFPVKQVSNAVALDERPARWRIGVIALATDHTTERDFYAICPADEVGVYVSRVVNENPISAENLRAMQPRLQEAAALILPDETVDAIAYSCTSASAMIGDDTVRNSIQAAKPGVPCVTPTSGAIAAFKTLGVNKVSVLTPYPRDVSAYLADYFESLGLEVQSVDYMNVTDDRDMARVTPATIVEAAEAAMVPEAEALFISCTALRGVSAVQTLEERLGKPVVSSNQAMIWQTLRAAGCETRRQGYGRLLAEH